MNVQIENNRNFGIQLIVVDNGFVYVGNIHYEDGFYVVTNGFNVRKSGTTRGFGELAFNGPLADSELDPCPPVLVPEGRMCHLIGCSAGKWAATIKA